MLEACRQAGVERVLVVTSSEVYGRRSAAEGPVQSARLAPVTPYGASKAAQDLIGAQYWRGYDLQVIRARAFPHGARTGSPLRVPLGRPPHPRGAEVDRGRPVLRDREPRSHAGRIACPRRRRGVCRAAASRHGGRAYNVCSGVGRTIGEALEALASLSNVEIGFEVDPGGCGRPKSRGWSVTPPEHGRRPVGLATHRWESGRDLLEHWRERVAREA